MKPLIFLISFAAGAFLVWLISEHLGWFFIGLSVAGLACLLPVVKMGEFDDDAEQEQWIAKWNAEHPKR